MRGWLCHALHSPALAARLLVARPCRSLFIAAVLVVPIGAFDTAADEMESCLNEEGDAAIVACSNAIRSGKLQGHTLAVAHVNRGVAYHKMGKFNNAIEDYTQSVHLDPQYILPLYNRGLAYTSVREY